MIYILHDGSPCGRVLAEPWRGSDLSLPVAANHPLYRRFNGQEPCREFSSVDPGPGHENGIYVAQPLHDGGRAKTVQRNTVWSIAMRFRLQRKFAEEIALVAL